MKRVGSLEASLRGFAVGTKNVDEVVFGNTVLHGQTFYADAGLGRREHGFDPHTTRAKIGSPNDRRGSTITSAC